MIDCSAGAGVAVLDNCLYAIGGFGDNAPLSSCERYDPLNEQWTMLPAMSCPRGLHFHSFIHSFIHYVY